MWDLVYIAVAIAFFAVMLLYVKACQVLGGGAGNGDRAS